MRIDALDANGKVGTSTIVQLPLRRHEAARQNVCQVAPPSGDDHVTARAGSGP